MEVISAPPIAPGSSPRLAQRPVKRGGAASGPASGEVVEIGVRQHVTHPPHHQRADGRAPGQRPREAAVDPAGAAQRRVNGLEVVGGGQDQHPLKAHDTVELFQKTGDDLGAVGAGVPVAGAAAAGQAVPRLIEGGGLRNRYM
nr:hypothetical protein [Paracoccus beibuensis]